MAQALITGASQGLGLALARALADRGWSLVIDARDPRRLAEATSKFLSHTSTVALPGDLADAAHRSSLVEAARRGGHLDLLVNNASSLGPSPQPRLRDYPLETLRAVYETNVIAPLALLQEAMPLLTAGAGRVINVTSDAAVEGYEGWGGYGSSKAALEQVSRVLAAEHPELRVYWVDPGDMNTAMHQQAFPGEDISDRPLPETSVPGFLALIEGGLPSGRYAARDLAAP